MIVNYLRSSSRSVWNIGRFQHRRFSASQSGKGRSVVPFLVVGGVTVGVGGTALYATKQYYPALFGGEPPVEVPPPEIKSYGVDSLVSQKEEEIKEMSEKLSKSKKNKKKKKVVEEEKTAEETVATILVDETEAGTQADETVLIPSTKTVQVIPEADEVVDLPQVMESLADCKFELPEEIISEINENLADSVSAAAPEPEEIVTSPIEEPLQVLSEVSTEEPAPVELVEVPTPEVEMVISESQSVEVQTDTGAVEEAGIDETELIMEALHSLDYEPVLSDSVLDLLVGKAASREKAVVATISRLENAMAGVVNDVEEALAHHNTTSALVLASKVNAQAISEATDKDRAREMLDKLLDSSASVRTAFEAGALLSEKVLKSFNKLGEVIEKAEQFNLQGPVSAARALLSKSRGDYYTSCQTAQEHQVDHALLAHYQKSVLNRKQVLDRELEILREHFPNQHSQLNQTFASADTHRAQVDELNTLITYLSNKVGRLDSELEEQQKAELEKLKNVAQAQKEEDARILEERLKGQAEQLRYEYEMQKETEVEHAVAAARDEAARHAERQADALRQEMGEAKERQIRDLTAFWSDEAALRESVVETEYQCKLEQSNAVLEGVSGMLETQGERYVELLHNRRLLNVTTALFDTINTGETMDSGKLRSTVELLRSHFSSDPLVAAVSASMPTSVQCQTFVQLKDRLGELEGECRKVALVISDECGIGSHILSRAMSALTIADREYQTNPSEGGSATLYYIAKAQGELADNNLDRATRYLNQLTGQPRTLIQDWLQDARTLLELRQSAGILLNYAKSKNNN